MRILLSWYTDPGYIAPPTFCEDQVTVGPALPGTSAETNSQYFQVSTPVGDYNLHEHMRSSGERLDFDLVVVFTDASGMNTPRGVQSFDCRTLLCVGDTHHMENPLQRMISYAKSEQFDYVVSTYNRNHLHWFVEAGLASLAWFPCVQSRALYKSIQSQREPRIGFLGQTGKFHPRRKHVLDAVAFRGFPLLAASGTPEYGASIYSTSTLSLNCSLNGDLNLRNLEIIAAGGCLVTDQLGWGSGMELLFDAETELVVYRSVPELLEKIEQLLPDPDRALAIAQRAQSRYLANWRPEMMRKRVLDWVFNGVLEEQFRGDWDPRLNSGLKGCGLPLRVTLYELLQEAHRTQEALAVFFDDNVPSEMLLDACDLPRICIGVTAESPHLVHVAGLGDVDSKVEPLDVLPNSRKWFDFYVRAGTTAEPPAMVACGRWVNLEI